METTRYQRGLAKLKEIDGEGGVHVVERPRGHRATSPGC